MFDPDSWIDPEKLTDKQQAIWEEHFGDRRYVHDHYYATQYSTSKAVEYMEWFANECAKQRLKEAL